MPVSLLKNKNVKRLKMRLDPDKLAQAAERFPYAFYLDSSDAAHLSSRYSYFGIKPFAVFKSTQGINTLETRPGSLIEELPGDPLTALDNAFSRYIRDYDADQTDVPEKGPVQGEQNTLVAYLNGGGVGYISYDVGRHIENVPSTARNEPIIPDIYVAFYDLIVCFEASTGTAYLVHDPALPNDCTHAELFAVLDHSQLGPEKLDLLPTRPRAPHTDNGNPLVLTSELDRQAYKELVVKAKKYIEVGDIYQVNLSHRFETMLDRPDSEVYNALRRYNSAPYGGYLKFPELSVFCSSPERFLASDSKWIETCPIKGTRPRGGDRSKDADQGIALLSSAKDKAEHVMIVDLERNDLGRICETGSVSVNGMMRLESFATVHHLVTSVIGKLRPGLSMGDILRATFPGGSITGAPKIRSMEIIEELEPVRRGVYTGALGYIGFDGQFDLSIAIRTMVKIGDRIIFSVGGGIVADSDPDSEYEETLHKAEGMLNALRSIDDAHQARSEGVEPRTDAAF